MVRLLASGIDVGVKERETLETGLHSHVATSCDSGTLYAFGESRCDHNGNNESTDNPHVVVWPPEGKHRSADSEGTRRGCCKMKIIIPNLFDERERRGVVAKLLLDKLGGGARWREVNTDTMKNVLYGRGEALASGIIKSGRR